MSSLVLIDPLGISIHLEPSVFQDYFVFSPQDREVTTFLIARFRKAITKPNLILQTDADHRMYYLAFNQLNPIFFELEVHFNEGRYAITRWQNIEDKLEMAILLQETDFLYKNF